MVLMNLSIVSHVVIVNLNVETFFHTHYIHMVCHQYACDNVQLSEPSNGTSYHLGHTCVACLQCELEGV